MRWLVLLPVLLVSCGPTPPAPPAEPTTGPSPRVHAFYYAWYGTPVVDGEYRHWNHKVYADDVPPFPGGDDIGSCFYPALGCYSSKDPKVLRTHMQQLRRARVGTLCTSWWGPGTFEDEAVPGLLRAAAAASLQVCFHLEPFEGRDATTARAALDYLHDRYGDHPALYRDPSRGGRSIVYVYDSYKTTPGEWARLLTPGGDLSIRDTPLDLDVIALWVEEGDGEKIRAGGFDGFYTYFATDGFTFGADPASWPRLAGFAREHDLLFIPCAGPGYDDTRIRPWNARNRREREAGAYYDRMLRAAVAVDPPLIGITSFNEWHEGTQIEPAVPRALDGYTYSDYAPLGPRAYLERTALHVDRYMRARAAR